MHWSLLVSLLSPLIAALGLAVGWRRYRITELRHDDVLHWANETIRVLRTTTVISNNKHLTTLCTSERMKELSVSISVLLEQGRMFFKNTIRGEYGLEKEPAYRGIRPTILDELLVAHQLASQWATLTEAERIAAARIAESCTRRFVSMAQLEVGRQRTAAIETGQDGDGVSFQYLLRKMEETGEIARVPLLG